jgi:glycerol-3-phosphate O-acyltransferase
VTGAVTLPVWLVVVIAVFAAIGIVDRIFAPSARWFFRRRFNRVIEELNDRLALGIQPFKLTKRQSLVDRLVFDPKVMDAIETQAHNTGMPRAVVMREAERYAREIVPAFSVTAYFSFGARAAKWLSEFVYRVRLGYSDDEALAAIDPHSAVVFVMNHRSNMDYVLVTYMASQRASLSYAVGEWARIFLLQTLIRSMGAYFIRRNSRNDLYRRVLGRYVNIATREGVTQAAFLEGGLSRDGMLNQPRLGLISYMVDGFDARSGRDIVFVPVGLNYDRVIEDRILTAKAEKEVTGREFRVRIPAIAGFFYNLIRLRVAGRLYRYGYACVSFGKPVPLSQWQKKAKVDFARLSPKRRFAAVERLGTDLMKDIGAIIPVTPVALVATVLQEQGGDWLDLEILERSFFSLIDSLEASGAHVFVPRSDREYSLETGLRMLVLRHIVEQDSLGRIRANPGERTLLAYYANAIAHLTDKQSNARNG